MLIRLLWKHRNQISQLFMLFCVGAMEIHSEFKKLISVLWKMGISLSDKRYDIIGSMGNRGAKTVLPFRFWRV